MLAIDNASLEGAVVRAALYHEMERLLGTCQHIVRWRNGMLGTACVSRHAAWFVVGFPDEGRMYFERQFWACAELWLRLVRGR